MATAVLFISWNGLRAGLAPEARTYLEAYGLPYLHGLREAGCERIEAASTLGHLDPLKGCALLFGERAALDRLASSADFARFARAMQGYFEHFAVTSGIPRETWPRRPVVNTSSAALRRRAADAFRTLP